MFDEFNIRRDGEVSPSHAQDQEHLRCEGDVLGAGSVSYLRHGSVCQNDQRCTHQDDDETVPNAGFSVEYSTYAFYKSKSIVKLLFVHFKRARRFNAEYITWNSEVEDAEYLMNQFVKKMIEPIQTADGQLLILKRFENLQLDCLSLDRRYLDVFKLYEKELELVKDTLVMIDEILYIRMR